MLRIQTWLVLLVLCAGNSEAWWFLNKESPTETPTETGATTPTGAPNVTKLTGASNATTPTGTSGAITGTSGAITATGKISATTSTAKTGATTPRGASGAATTTRTSGTALSTATNATKKMEVEDDNLSGIGEEIINVATGIRKFVEAWDATTAAWTTNGGPTEKVESANPNTTGNANKFRGELVVEGSGIGVGDMSGSDIGSDVDSVMVLTGDKVLPGNLTGIIGDVSEINGTVEGDPMLPCLPVPSDWSICSGKWSKWFTLPNFLNHTSVEEVGLVLQEWAWLAREGCHHSAEWFLCLLLAPGCPSTTTPVHLPCRNFCQVLQDSCWASLENGRLPVECHLLPERSQEPGHSACVSVSNRKGNPWWVRMYPVW